MPLIYTNESRVAQRTRDEAKQLAPMLRTTLMIPAVNEGEKMKSNEGPAKDASHYQTSGASVHAARDWISVLENLPYGGVL
jgi:hypothetical protein